MSIRTKLKDRKYAKSLREAKAIFKAKTGYSFGTSNAIKVFRVNSWPWSYFIGTEYQFTNL